MNAYVNLKRDKNLVGVSKGRKNDSLRSCISIPPRWQMPVIGYYIEPGTIWKTGVNANLPWLCDRVSIGIGVASVGDFFIVVAAVLSVVFFTVKMLNKE
jgi:hypothetical protein